MSIEFPLPFLRLKNCLRFVLFYRNHFLYTNYAVSPDFLRREIYGRQANARYFVYVYIHVLKRKTGILKVQNEPQFGKFFKKKIQTIS
jgi:hypothetical protein